MSEKRPASLSVLSTECVQVFTWPLFCFSAVTHLLKRKNIVFQFIFSSAYPKVEVASFLFEDVGVLSHK